MEMTRAARRWVGLPLALQITGLLLCGLVVAQLVTLALTLLLPPDPPPQYELGDIAQVLSGSVVANPSARSLQRLVQDGPPELVGPGWLTSERSRRELATLLGRSEADVQLFFFTPLPFAGSVRPMPRVEQSRAPLPSREGRWARDALGTAGFMRVDFQIAQAGRGPGGPPGGGFPGPTGAGPRRMDIPALPSRPADPKPAAPAPTPAPAPQGTPPKQASDTPGASPPVAADERSNPTPSAAAQPPVDSTSRDGPATSGARTQSTAAKDAAPTSDAKEASTQSPAPVSTGPSPERATTNSVPATRSTPRVSNDMGVAAQAAPDPKVSAARSTPTAPSPASTTDLRRIEAPQLAASDAATALAPGLPRATDPSGATTPGARDAAVPPAALAARRPIAVAPIANGLFGFVPATFVEGDFVAAVQLMDGMWAVVQPTPEPFPNAWQRRLLLWFAVAAAVVTPLGWLFSRRLVRPITAFAAAAEQLGRDPTAAILPLEGPAEVGRAAHAFNRMQSRLRSFVDDRTAMIGAISHDLRTPLTRMRFRVEDIPDDQRDGMLLEVQEMEQMITSVLAFIRDASEPGARETLDLSSLVEDVVEDAVFVGHDVVLDRTEKAAVDVDAIGMRRLLSNLVENAVKYGERAHVRLFTDRNDAVAEISDDGPGLPDDELERVFQPFYRAPNARASAKQGSGLGLAVCRSIARGHGGDVQLTRGARGLVARVRLPLAYGAAARP